MQEKNNWLMATHLSAFVGYFIPFGNILGPFILWQIKQNDIPELVSHAKSVLNFQLTVTIAAILLVFIPIIGWVALAGVAIFAIIQIVIGAMKASKGELYRYPFSLQLIK